MYKRERHQRGFYDAVYEAGVPEGHFLRRFEEVVDWRRFKRYFQRHYYERGRDAHNPLLMFKLLILQFLYNLSDRELEESARDRLSFRWFCGIDPVGCPPDYTCFCRFRDRICSETLKRLFDSVVEQAAEKGMVVDKLSIVDSTEIKAKVDIFKLDPPSGGCSPDPDASFGKKSEKKSFYGYKAHVAMDEGSEIITRIEASPGDVHDSSFFDVVHDPDAEVVTADRAYDSEENFNLVRSFGQIPAIMLKRKRGMMRGHVISRYFSDELGYYYRYKGRRKRIEHKIGEAKRYHGLGCARYWGLEKMRIQVFLTAIAMNLKRMVHLDFGKARWQMI